jgi:hypothetical protein
LKDIDNLENFEQVYNYDDVLIETKLVAKKYVIKTKNIKVGITKYDMLIIKKSSEVNIPYTQFYLR